MSSEPGAGQPDVAFIVKADLTLSAVAIKTLQYASSYHERVFKDEEIRINDRNIVFYVEIKPSLGDDYPAVLRQIKDQKRRSCGRSFNGSDGNRYSTSYATANSPPRAPPSIR